MAEKGMGQDYSTRAAESMDFQVVGLRVGGEEYALDILDIVGIERLENVLQFPRMPSFIAGVMRIRGEVVPLIRLRSRFGFDERGNDERTRVIVISIVCEEGEAPRTVGCIVDSVTSVYRLSRADVEQAPPMALTVESRFVNGVINMGERMLILLNPHEILFGEETDLLARAAVVAEHYAAAESGEQP